ncbi:unnamed protein product [Adineta steineri]|uniref:Uncharacterized protein n=1 Tax=Adineta steineri TaxID=433720 RepID=A0A815TKK5_9BILA|nr:unnamed protein product [Adineta steineri]CAF1647023.1 unnamed protein product [Adineta steineri]
MKFEHYTGILFGGYGVLLLFEICFFMSLPNRLLAKLVEKLFGIIRLDHQRLIMNFFGINIDFLSSRRFRLSLIIQLAFIPWITLVLLVDGCIFQLQHLSGRDFCPVLDSDCFLMDKPLTYERILCPPGEILSNSTSTNAICFVLIYTEQSTISVLNQIGICSSVFSLLCHVFKGTCYMSHKWWGLIVFILLLIISVTLLIVSFLIIEMNISFTSKLLLTALSCLLINVMQLLQFTHYYRRNRVQPSTIIMKTCL